MKKQEELKLCWAASGGYLIQKVQNLDEEELQKLLNITPPPRICEKDCKNCSLYNPDYHEIW